MKKVFLFVLATVMLLSLLGCGGAPAEQTQEVQGLQAGFGREKITPDYNIYLQGGSWRDRLSTGILDYQYVTCVALKDGETTVLLYTMDLKLANDVFVDPAKLFVSGATGVPQANILFNATHTHSAPAIRYNWDGVENYRAFFNEAAAKAAEAALADLAAAEIYAGGVQAEGMAYVRHYVDAEGNVVLRSDPKLAAHIREADQELQLVKLARADKKDILLMSFPAHATFNESGTELSADFPGPTRDHIEANADCLVAYFIGAAGNQTPGSKIPGKTYSSDYREYGKKLGQYALDALDSLAKVEGDGVKLEARSFTAPTNKKGIDKLVAAREVKNVIDQYGSTSAQAKEAMEKHGFTHYLEPTFVITRAGLEATMTMELKVMSLGSMAFILAPYKMFGHHGTDVKTQSPYDNTFIVSCSEGAFSYIASTEAFDYNSYESFCCYFEQGTGEKLVTEFVDMLTQMKNAQ